MTYYPVVIPTMSRYEHFKNCVESLSKNTHADKTELVIGLDYPVSEKYEVGWKKIKDYIPIIKGFRKVTVFEHKKNLGAGDNLAFVIDYACNHYTAYIATEDDNIFSPCFLDYMNKCLEKYKDDKSVMAVCSYINKDEYANDQCGNTVFRIKGAYNAWGTGKWKHKYNLYVNEIKADYRKKICDDKGVLKAFNRTEQFSNFLEWLENPSLNGYYCDIACAMYNLIYDKYVIYPTEYIGKNMGFDGSGEHCEKIEDDPFSKREIIDWKEYNVIDNFKSEIDKKNQKMFNKAQNRRLSFKKTVFTKVIIILYFLFGYDKTEKFRRYILKVMKRV